MKIIITENQVDKIKSKIHEYVKKYGFEKSREIFGDKVLFTIGFNNDPMEFLNMFNDLEIIRYEDPNWVLFLNKKRELIMTYNIINSLVYINYDIIWSVLNFYFKLTYHEVQELTEEWVSDKYNLINVNTREHSPSAIESWVRNIN